MPTLGELLFFAVGVIILAQILTFVIDDLPWPRWHIKLPQWLVDWAKREQEARKEQERHKD